VDLAGSSPVPWLLSERGNEPPAISNRMRVARDEPVRHGVQLEPDEILRGAGNKPDGLFGAGYGLNDAQGNSLLRESVARGP
jgi:hypothetical protein